MMSGLSMSAADSPIGPLPGSTADDVIASTLLLIPDAALWIDADGRVRAANARAAAMFRGDVVGATYAELVGPAGGPGAVDPGTADAGPPGGGHDVRGGSTVEDDAGRGVGVRLDGVPFAVDARIGDAPGGSLCTLREPPPDTVLRLAEQHFDAAFDTAPIGMALFNPDGEYIRANAALGDLLGEDPDALLGRRDQEFTHPDDREADVTAAWEILRGERSTHQCEKRFVRADGSVVWVIANMAFLRDELGRPISWVGQFQDITERHRAAEDLQEMADRDPLTGLLNRRAFDRELHRHLGAEPDGVSGLLVLDLDGFKAINDAHGHRAGDDVLVRCAEGLRDATRSGDLVARLGGDEFSIFVPGIDGPGLAALCARVVEAVRDASGALAVTASIGAASTAEVGACADSLLAEADRRMYAVKTSGR
jgi:diguanylate cyclase (GGDEF)-like protein/PAS domain S-box-containing protein